MRISTENYSVKESSAGDLNDISVAECGNNSGEQMVFLQLVNDGQQLVAMVITATGWNHTNWTFWPKCLIV